MKTVTTTFPNGFERNHLEPEEGDSIVWKGLRIHFDIEDGEVVIHASDVAEFNGRRVTLQPDQCNGGGIRVKIGGEE